MSSFADFLTQAPGLTLWVFALMCVISLLGSMIATTLGLGGGALVLAVMALNFPPAVLVPVHGVVQAGSNFNRVILMRKEIILHLLPVFVAGSVVGAMFGAKLVISLPVSFLQMVLAVFILYAAWAPRFSGGSVSNLKYFLVGIVGSFVTMFVGATGPLIAPFAAAVSSVRHQVIATHAAFMSVQHGFKIIAFGVLGFSFWPFVPLLVAMIAFGFLGTVIGKRLLNRLPERSFRIGFRMVLSLLALKLLYGAVTDFLA